MDELLSEKEQLEQIRNWWRANGLYVLGGIVLGVAILVGWNKYQAFKETRAQAASLIMEELYKAVTQADQEKAESLLGQLRADYAPTPYWDHARLAMAKLYVDEEKLDEAAGILEEVTTSAVDGKFAAVARLRLARVLWASEKTDEAINVLKPVSGSGYDVVANELRGDIFAAAGDADAARLAYQAALDSHDPELSDKSLLEIKLADLDTAPPAGSPVDESVEADSEIGAEVDG